MLYKINDKYYIKVQGYYKQVKVTKDGNNLDIQPVTRGLYSKIEVARAKNVNIVDINKENFNRNKSIFKIKINFYQLNDK